MPILKSCPHRVKTLVGTDRIVTKLSNKICTYMLCDKKYGRKKRWISLLASKIIRCKFFADLYYKSVLIFGRFYWSNPSENWCKNCTKDLGDPFKPLRHYIKNVTYMNFQLTNTSNWNTCPMISERLDIWPKAK